MGKDNSTEDKVKKAVRVARVNKIIEAVVMIVFGLALVIWSGTAMLVVFRVIAALVAIAGIAVIVGFMFGRSNVYGSSVGLFGGVIAAVLGMYLFFNPDILVALGPTIIGLIIIVTGIVDVTEAIHIERQHSGGTTAALVIGVIELILGVIFIMNPDVIQNILFILMGLCLIADGITDIWVMFQIGKTAKDVAADIAAVQNGEFVDAQTRPLENDAAAGAEEAPSESFVDRAKARAAARKQEREAKKAAEAAAAAAQAAETAAAESAAAPQAEDAGVDGYTTIPHAADIPSANDIAEEIPPQ